MGKAKDLSDFDKGQIVMARRLGKSISETATLVGCSRYAVVSTYQRWSETGDTSSRRQGVGRPRLIDARGQRRLSRIVRSDRRDTVADITHNFNRGEGPNVSEHTVHRTLLDMGLRSRRPIRVPMLTAVHRRKRLQWARNHRHWTIDDWKRVSWSDESRFLLHYVDGRARVRRLPKEAFSPGCTVGRTQAGGGSVMVWAIFSWGTLGPIIPVEQTMTAVTYLNIVADQVHPFMVTVFPGGDGVFQQDNAPCHTAKKVQEWFQEHDEEFPLLPWSPNSPDMNPIEHLWFDMEKRLRAASPQPRNLRELRDLLLQSWYQISRDTYQHLVESMPRRVRTLLAARVELPWPRANCLGHA